MNKRTYIAAFSAMVIVSMFQLYDFVTAECGELLSIQEQTFTDRRPGATTLSDTANISHISEAGKSIMQCTEDENGTATKVKQSGHTRCSISSHAADADAGLISIHSDHTHGKT